MIWNRSVIFTDAHIRRATACRSWMPYGGRTRIRPHQTIPCDESTARSLLTRRNRNVSPFSRLHVFNRPVADTPSHKSQGRMTDGCRHPAHLTVSPFADCQLEPTVGYALAEADRRIAGPESGIGNAFDLGRPGKDVFQTNASPQRMQACLCSLAFYRYEIGFGHLEPRISAPRSQKAVLCARQGTIDLQMEAQWKRT